MQGDRMLRNSLQERDQLPIYNIFTKKNNKNHEKTCIADLHDKEELELISASLILIL